MESYQQLYALLDAALRQLHTSLQHEPKELYEPQQYILSLGGKRIRPLLTLIGSDLLEGDPSKALNAALSVELFHNFSLMHDDIMDKAPLRRGSITVHEKWNSNIAILSGDAMLVKAYEKLAACEPEHLPALLMLFNRTAIEVCEGQQLDMNFEARGDVQIREYLEMISLKTAVLLGCSLQMGAILAGADLQTQQSLYTFGKEIGVAFQLKDDILDVFADQDKFGKQSGGDIISNKKTFLLLKCLELANEKQKKEIDHWLHAKEFDKAQKVAAVKNIYDQLHIRAHSEQEMQRHYTAALQSISAVSCHPQKKKALLYFAENLMNREA